MGEPLLEIRNLTCKKEDSHSIFSNLNFTVNQNDILVLQGKSGSGKTTLMKCISHLNVYGGEILFRGKKPNFYGIPAYRTRVLYVPQRPSLLPGTPQDFVNTINSFSARKSSSKSNKEGGEYTRDPKKPMEIAKAWGVDEELWERTWSNLSGGESQRVALAVAVGVNTAEILLLDEPTSALDPESATNVEEYLVDQMKSSQSALKAMIWVTHSEEQGRRLGNRFMHISADGAHEEEPLADV